jgi:hypothetical protein
MAGEAYPTGREDDLEYRVARAIFEAQRDFPLIDGEEPLPDRHFDVAIALYLCMAREAIGVIRQADAGK